MNQRTKAAAAVLCNFAAVLLAFALVWAPEVRLFWIGFPAIQQSAITAARVKPARAVLDEIADEYLGIATLPGEQLAPGKQLLAEAAQDALNGRVRFGNDPYFDLPFPFRASSLDIGLPSQQLRVAAMGRTRILLAAYRTTGNERFLRGALEDTLAFDEVDRTRLIPRGLLWNDHALATRVAILADLWSQVRHRADLDDRDAAVILGLADRTAARLAKKELFTFRTNHGVMQSLALLQFAIAFPTLDRAAEARAVGCSRLREQMEFYIDAEGITLEHSAGYHAMGRRMLSLAMRLFTASGCEVPADWSQKMRGANEFARLLLRPDGTLPAIGNTDNAPWPVEELAGLSPAPERDFALFPVAGFAVFWSGLAGWPNSPYLAQTTVTWSSFPSQAHKLADDMSVIVWAAGRSWLTNTGYWPYGIWGYSQANGWRGSNAPHLSGEAANSARTTVLKGFANGPRMRFVDMERIGRDNGAILRRQVVAVDGTTWIIVDSRDDAMNIPVERLWTTTPETRIEKVDDRSFLLRPTDSPYLARISFLGDTSGVAAIRIGEREPFAGWIVRSGRPGQSPSIEVQQAKGLVVTVLSVAMGNPAIAKMTEGSQVQQAERWDVQIGQSPIRIQREGSRITLKGGGQTELLDISAAPPQALEKRRAIVAAYSKAAASYPYERELTYYRIKLSLLMLGLVLLQEGSVLLVRRMNVAVVPAVRVTASLLWVGLGLYAYVIYLR